VSGFASTKDLADKRVSFDELGPGLYGYTAEGDPNSGVVVGDKGVLVVDAQATPAMAADVIHRIREVTDKPVTHLVLTHYHAVRVLGAAGYPGAEIIASETTRNLISERGQQDMDSEIGRFPRLFRGRESIPGLTWPGVTFRDRMTLWMGAGREAQIIHIGRSHTAGDTVVWLPEERVLFAGDVVEFGATPYCGDAHFTDWPATLAAVRALGAERLVPGRGRALLTRAECEEAIEGTRAFTADLFGIVKRASAGATLKEVYDQAIAEMRPKYGRWVIFEHCMPFNVTRAWDEARGLDHPRIWTAERDVEMWRALEQGAPMRGAEAS
jgi:glyoxylase-like metal-dependent hydrolase (beta-lactamase superfamily II)